MTPLERKENEHNRQAVKDVIRTVHNGNKSLRQNGKLILNTWADEDSYAHPQPDYVGKALTILAILVAVLIGGCIAGKKAFASDLIDLNKIIMIESGGRNIHSSIKSEHAIGLFQITPVVLQEYNQFHRKSYKSNDLYNVDLNRAVASWYLNTRIPAMLRAYKKPVTVKNVIVAYNAGISYVVKNKTLPSITVKYLKKYGVA